MSSREATARCTSRLPGIRTTASDGALRHLLPSLRPAFRLSFGPYLGVALRLCLSATALRFPFEDRMRHLRSKVNIRSGNPDVLPTKPRPVPKADHFVPSTRADIPNPSPGTRACRSLAQVRSVTPGAPRDISGACPVSGARAIEAVGTTTEPDAVVPLCDPSLGTGSGRALRAGPPCGPGDVAPPGASRRPARPAAL